MHCVTDRRTDRRQGYAKSWSYCVEVRSAKNLLKIQAKVRNVLIRRSLFDDRWNITCLKQTMNILISGQCVIDMCASFFTLLTAIIVVDGTHMSRDSIYSRCVVTWQQLGSVRLQYVAYKNPAVDFSVHLNLRNSAHDVRPLRCCHLSCLVQLQGRP